MLTVRSHRVSTLNPGMATQPLDVQSNRLKLAIVPALPEWERKTLLEATMTLDSTRPSETSFPNKTRGEAIHALQYLGTPQAAVALVRYLDVMDLGDAAYLGLISSKTPAPALQEMRRLLTDPGWPVTLEFLSTMEEVALPRDLAGNAWRARQDLKQKLLGDLESSVERKTGDAKRISQHTILIKTQHY